MLTVMNAQPLTGHTKDLIRIAMLAQHLGTGYALATDAKILIYLDADDANDLSVMMACSKLEAETGLEAEIHALGTLAPGEQHVVRVQGTRF